MALTPEIITAQFLASITKEGPPFGHVKWRQLINTMLDGPGRKGQERPPLQLVLQDACRTRGLRGMKAAFFTELFHYKVEVGRHAMRIMFEEILIFRPREEIQNNNSPLDK